MTGFVTTASIIMLMQAGYYFHKGMVEDSPSHGLAAAALCILGTVGVILLSGSWK